MSNLSNYIEACLDGIQEENERCKHFLSNSKGMDLAEIQESVFKHRDRTDYYSRQYGRLMQDFLNGESQESFGFANSVD